MMVRIVTPGIFPEHLTEAMGAALKLELDLAKQLHDLGYAVEILSRHPYYLPKIETGDFGKLVRVPVWKQLKFRCKDLSYHAPLLMWVVCRMQRCDVLHANTDPFLLYLPRAKKKILHLHMSIENYRSNYSYLRALHKADHIICCSRYVKGQVLRYTNFPRDRVSVVYNWVDQKTFELGNQKVLREKLGIEEDTVVILYSGQINKEKGLDVLIRSLKFVETERPILLLVAGSSTLWPRLDTKKYVEYIEYEKRIRKISKDLNTRFLGKLGSEKLPEVYHACDIFVFPSVVQEGLGVVVLEAMSAGKPVIASNVGGVPELVEHGKEGLLVPPGDVEKLSKAIECLVINEDMRRHMGRQAITKSRKFNKKKSLEKILEIYEA